MAKPVVTGIENFWTCLVGDEKNSEFLKSCNISKVHGKTAEIDKAVPTKYLLMDVDGGLDRLYGGFFNDWIHGGQWCRTFQFLSKLIKCIKKSKMEMVFVFNGTMEDQRICEWFANQIDLANRSDRIVQIVGRRGIPPPKAFWIPPIAVESTLKLIFANLKCPILVTHSEHIREVIAALHNEPPKIASTPQTSTGLDPSVMTAASLLPCPYEGLFAERADYFVLDNKQLPHMFSAHSLKLSVKQMLEAREMTISTVLNYFEIPESHLLIFLTILGSHILTVEDLTHYFCEKLHAKKNKDGGLEWAELLQTLAKVVREVPESLVSNPSEIASKIFGELEPDIASNLISKFSRQYFYFKSLTNKEESESKEFPASLPNMLAANSIITPSPSIKRFAALGVSLSQLPNVIASLGETFKPSIYKIDDSLLEIAKERHSQGHMHPWILQLMIQGEIKLPTCIEPHACVQGVNANVVVPVEDVPPLLVHLYRPVRQNAYAVLFDIAPVLTIRSTENTEAKEQQSTEEIEQKVASEPAATESTEGKPAEPCKTVLIREWFIERANGVPTPAVDLVPSIQLESFENPPISKLWLSRDSGDWLQRLRTFLNCFRSDVAMMTSPSYVQPRHVIPCAVLRYLLSQSVGILLPHEFDALIAQAVSPALQNPDYLADMELVSISARGIHLSSIFMRGVEHAIFVNDVCGQPIQAEYTSPWLFFDGKLFQTKLSLASQGATPRDLCDGNYEQLTLFSNIRQAILDNLQPHFARYRLSPQSGYLSVAPLSVPSSSEIVVMAGSRSVHPSRPHDQPAQISSHKGGHLDVGGVAVSHWGAYRGQSIPAQAAFGYGYSQGFGYYPPWGQPYYAHPQYYPHNAPGGRRGKAGGIRRGSSAGAITGMGRGRGFVPSGRGGRATRKPGVGRGGSVIEKSEHVEDAGEISPEVAIKPENE